METAVKRAFAVILYALGKSSYGFIAKLFGVTPPAVQKWLKQEAEILKEPEISAEIREMEFDEMWHFVGSKKQKMDYQSRGSFCTANCGLGYRRS
jgi:predicted transcriptional regulator